jgi:peptidoglycan/LPS O-acetylase OafA/YrhL
MIPFIFGLILIVPPQGYYAKLTIGEDPGNYFSYLLSFFTDLSDLSGYTGGFSPTHLWFILYLFVLSIIALPLLLLLKRESAQSTISKLANVFSNPILFILLSIPLSATQLLPSPGGQNPFYYLCIFLFGYIACTSSKYQEMFNRYRLGALICVLILAPTWIVLRIQGLGGDELLEIFKNANLMLAMIVLLGFGNKYLNFTNKWLSYMNEAAFPVYILHQTVLVVVGYYLVQLNLGITVKFFIIMALTLLISVAIYEWIIKRTPITRWMFGIKSK